MSCLNYKLADSGVVVVVKVIKNASYSMRWPLAYRNIFLQDKVVYFSEKPQSKSLKKNKVSDSMK